ncbi:hypothetical protein [Thaumasiovibrio subtropicus]|uniref:hypothetical protein n=1 Tax=Thaumasiovibrio subtropicus TaxID=1891207 RepID=UPI000B3610F0|nr:hypothetical protein [Thaumasiovibrio subtropicus]
MRFVWILALLLSGVVQAKLPENERVCEDRFTQNMLNQQRIFSDRALEPKVRRHAERAIDHAREVYGNSHSFCAANDALVHYAEDESKTAGHAFRDGEVNYFGRGGLNFRFGKSKND